MPVEPGGRRGFESTLWSVVVRAQAGSEAERRAALERLCGIYWPPLYAYLLHKGLAREDAQDAIQGFFAYFLGHGLIERVEAGRGRFRAYLRGVLDRYLANERRRGGADKRGGGVAALSLDFTRADQTTRMEPSHRETPDAAYARAWRLAVVDQAFNALRGEYDRQGASARFSIICAHLSAVEERLSYSDLARKLECSETDVTNLLHRARKRLRELIRHALRETVETETELEEEIRDLFRSA